jgi:hypothetical protein
MTPSIHRTPSLVAGNCLASLMVLAMFLMSLGVDTCETSCLMGHVRCADDLAQSSGSAESMNSPSMDMRDATEYAFLAMRIVALSGSRVPRMESALCSSDEFCKDASTSVMRPSGRAEIQKARWATFGAVFAENGATGDYLVSKPGSPPPRTADPPVYSMTLRI